MEYVNQIQEFIERSVNGCASGSIHCQMQNYFCLFTFFLFFVTSSLLLKNFLRFNC